MCLGGATTQTHTSAAIYMSSIKGVDPLRIGTIEQIVAFLLFPGVAHDRALHQAIDGLVDAGELTVFHFDGFLLGE